LKFGCRVRYATQVLPLGGNSEGSVRVRHESMLPVPACEYSDIVDADGVDSSTLRRATRDRSSTVSLPPVSSLVVTFSDSCDAPRYNPVKWVFETVVTRQSGSPSGRPSA
jgi:hypothetical protein